MKVQQMSRETLYDEPSRIPTKKRDVNNKDPKRMKRKAENLVAPSIPLEMKVITCA